MGIINGEYYFLQGGGEMGEIIRAKDWSKTPLGDPATWPQSLCTMVSVMLNNPFAMYIAWGSEYTQLYNDAYRPILGASKHPQALGISTRETFSEIWHIIESMFNGVMDGKAVGYPDFMLPLNRYGYEEQCYFDFSYSPIRKDNGEVGGVLVTVIETTNRKKAEQALQEIEQRFRGTVKQAPLGICILRGKDYIVEMANDAYLHLIDREESQIVGRPLLEALPETKQSVHAILDKVINTGLSYHGNEIPVPLSLSGKHKVVYLDFHYHPLKEKDGEISGILVTVIDVTEKVMANQQLKENEKLLQSIFYNAPVAIAVITGPQHTYVLANNDYQHMVNRTQDQLVGKTSKDIFPELIGTGTFEIFDNVYRSGQPFSLAEYPVKLDKNNEGNVEQMYFRFSAVPLKDAAGKFDSIVIVAVDITEQVVARRRIEESEKRFQLLVRDATAAIIVLTGPEMKVEIVNEAYTSPANLTPDDLLGKPLFSVIPDTSGYYLPILEKVRQTGEMLQLFDSPYAGTINGKYVEGFLHITYQPYRNTEGHIEGVMVIMQDVTEAVQARKKIEQSEKRFEAAIDAVQGIMWTNNAEGQMQGEQPGWAKLTGQSFEEYQGYGWANVVHPEDVQPTVQAWHIAVANQTTFEFQHRVNTKQNGYRLFSIKAVPAFDEKGVIQQWVGVHTDITEQKLAEEKLAYRTALLEAHNEANVDGVLLVDVTGKILSFNQRFIEIWNMPESIVYSQNDEAALSFAMEQLVDPQQFIDKVKYLYDNPTQTSIDELEFKDGRIIERSGYPVIGENSIYYAWSWTFKDITAKKNYEKQIKESEERFRSLAQTLPQLIWVTDAHGVQEFASVRWKEYSGIELSDEKLWEAIVHPDDYDHINAVWANSLTTGNVYTADVRLKNKYGEYRWHTVIGEPVLNKENKIEKWVGAFTDIHSEKLSTQELELKVKQRTQELEQFNIELERKNKELESFAYISSHDLQEPLRKIQTFASLIIEKEYQALSATGKDHFKRMNDAANRMQTLIQDLLVYSRTNTSERNFEHIDLNKIVDDVKEDLSEEIKGKNATIQAIELPEVKIIPFQFRQLMHNLITNALKFSVPHIPPHIQIKCEVAKGINFNNPKLNPHQEYCHIMFSDNGIGFEQQYSEKIFEVFQRLHAKNQYHGTGIGLAIVKKIVENHQGIITASSELNKGARFDIYIPAT